MGALVPLTVCVCFGGGAGRPSRSQPGCGDVTMNSSGSTKTSLNALETRHETHCKMAPFFKKAKGTGTRNGVSFYLHPSEQALPPTLPQPTPSCHPGCLAGIHCNLFSFIMLICGRKDSCHLRMACMATVNTLACL